MFAADQFINRAMKYRPHRSRSNLNWINRLVATDYSKRHYTKACYSPRSQIEDHASTRLSYYDKIRIALDHRTVVEYMRKV